MYICPVCNRKFNEEEKFIRHFLVCWREKNPFHISKEASRSENIEIKVVNEDVTNFFNSLK